MLASLICFQIKATFFVGTFIFLATPSVFLSLFHRKYVNKLLIAALASIPLGGFVDYIMEQTGGWFAPYSVFGNFKLFHYIIPDLVIWFFFYVYFVLIYYESFIHKKKKVKLYYPHMKYFLLGMVLLIAIFVWTNAFNPALLKIDYFYIKFGIFFCIIPITLVLAKFPKFWAKFFQTGTYFFYFSSIYEFTGLVLNQWTFPGKNQYIGFIQILSYRIPFEEFFVWILLGALAILSFYEFFDDGE